MKKMKERYKNRVAYNDTYAIALLCYTWGEEPESDDLEIIV